MRVNKLQLSFLKIKDWNDLKSFTSIKSLDLSWTNVRDANINILINLTYLTSLHLVKTSITDEGMNIIANLKLIMLNVSSCKQITNFGVDALKGMESLEELCVGRTNVTDEGIQNLINLRKLMVYDTKFAGHGMIKMKKLEYLNINYCVVTENGFNIIAKLKKLRNLQMCWCKFSNEWLKNLKKLDELNITGCDITDEDMISLQSVRSLNISKCSISNVGLNYLAHSEMLRELTLDIHGQTTNEGLKMLGQIVKLHITGIILSDELTDVVEKLTELNELTFNGHFILTNERVEKLKKHKSLRKFIMWGCGEGIGVMDGIEIKWDNIWCRITFLK